ncbi:mercuric reductase [Rhodanobacter sp. DHG33]|uniref:mercuric reductase n=1 Tax=Rhodanobacter sp. DHG33 TaxID=2775921 RepID=UPI00178508F2|nr:mercuric reductase [Rhodanobacter sp. DHG33]MBD8898321.1 mercuric reductase [Rhodanobacter sp. DHG33]
MTQPGTTPSLPQDEIECCRVEHLHPTDWRNPEPAARYHLVVIGAGPAGVAAARTAAAAGARVALLERAQLGGTSLNTGCAPSKALIRTARLCADLRDAAHYGARIDDTGPPDFARAMARMRRIRARLADDTSAQRLAAAGIDLFFGEARFAGTDCVRVGDTLLHFGKALIATGARPSIPAIPGLAEAGYLTHENVFDLTALPARLLVIGGGPLGCEMAQAFCRLGARVTLVQDRPLFLPREERDAAQLLSDALARDGIAIRLNTRITAVHAQGDVRRVEMISDNYHTIVEVDAILTGIGHVARAEGLDLERAEVDFNRTSGVLVDDFLRTSNPRIYAAGDVCMEHKYTHAAVAAARIAVCNALFRGHERLSRLVIPWCTFTDPEIAHVGLYVREANRRGIPVKTYTVPMHEIDRAVMDSEQEGFAKIHVQDGTDHILGATVVARHAGEMINGITLAMESGLGLRGLERVIHAYPTQAEAIHAATDAYRASRLTARVRARLARWLDNA